MLKREGMAYNDVDRGEYDDRIVAAKVRVCNEGTQQGEDVAGP